MRVCFKEATNERSVGVVILTCSGASSAGGDVGDFAGLSIDVDRAMNAHLKRLSYEMRTGAKPIIVRVNGYWMGAGNEFNLQCDLTVAAETVRFGQDGPKMGSTPNWWVTRWLPLSIGEKRARKIAYLCNRYTTQDAEQMDWVNRVVQSDELGTTVDERCRALLEESPTTMRLAKMAIDHATYELSRAVRLGHGSHHVFPQHRRIARQCDGPSSRSANPTFASRCRGASVPYVIGAACIDVKDMSCIEECPVDCIYQGEHKLYIQPSECIDCGACEPVCPVEAISSHRVVPADQKEFVADNVRFFLEVLPGRSAPLGSPGGSRKVGPVGADTPFVQLVSAGGAG